MCRKLTQLLATLLTANACLAQVIVGEPLAVGFRAATPTGSSFIARTGQWAPIQLRLSLQGTLAFQGQIRCETPDLDGDLVCYCQFPVVLTAQAGPRRVFSYAVFSTTRTGSNSPPAFAEVLTEGLPLDRFRLPDFELASGDCLIILDISERPVARLRSLQTDDWAADQTTFAGRPYYRAVLICSLSPEELPDRWFGLEAINAIVWDRPNPTDPQIAQKLDVLRQWVECGGQLIVGLGSAWPATSQSQLAPLLPLEAAQNAAAGKPQPDKTHRSSALTDFYRAFGAADPQAREKPPRPLAVTVAPVRARKGALPIITTQLEDGTHVDLMAAHWLRSGRVIALAASLDELLQTPVNDSFFGQLFNLHPTTPKFRQKELKANYFFSRAQTGSLYNGLTEPISFRAFGGALVLAAFAFAVAYIGVGTLASWVWLRHRGILSASWPVFAAIAIAASGLSLATVAALRRISGGLRVVSLVDVEAGESAAMARCYFGYMAGTQGEADLSLPGAGSFLRPLCPGPGPRLTYATPQRYAAAVSQAALERAPLRATLKQFEGFWHGTLKGSIRAELVADRATGKITPASWIENGLNVSLSGGYLLYVDPRLPDSALALPAGQLFDYRGYSGIPAGLNVLAVWIPPLKPGEKASALGQADYEAVAAARQRALRRERPGRLPDLLTLYDEQQAWVEAETRAPQRGLSAAARAALLASTRSLYLNCRQVRDSFDEPSGRPVLTDGLMNCDVTSWLVRDHLGSAGRGQAVLLLLADDPGPATLQANGRPIKPTGGLSLYRVRVPLTLLGQPPEPQTPEQEAGP
jgi:hypothetical protein